MTRVSISSQNFVSKRLRVRSRQRCEIDRPSRIHYSSLHTWIRCTCFCSGIHHGVSYCYECTPRRWPWMCFSNLHDACWRRSNEPFVVCVCCEVRWRTMPNAWCVNTVLPLPPRHVLRWLPVYSCENTWSRHGNTRSSWLNSCDSDVSDWRMPGNANFRGVITITIIIRIWTS